MLLPRFLFPTLLLLFLPRLSCLSDPASTETPKADPPPLAEQIQPRNLGAKWIFDVTLFNPDGTTKKDGDVTEEVVRAIELEGVICYQVKLTTDPRSFVDKLRGKPLPRYAESYFWEYQDAKGSHDYTEDSDENTTPESLEEFELTLPYPVEAGHTYQLEESAWKVLAVGKTVKVPAGEFECVVYQQTVLDAETPEHSARYRFYGAPGTGLVRFEIDDKVDGEWQLTSRDDLRSSDLGQKKPTAPNEEP